MKLCVISCTLFTDPSKVDPASQYWANVETENTEVEEALRRAGYEVERVSWDDPAVDWDKYDYGVIRTVWNYYELPREFGAWLSALKLPLINPRDLIEWNQDKRYLAELQDKHGIAIPPTLFITPEREDKKTLRDLAFSQGWDEVVLKPAIGGAAYLTFRLRSADDVTPELETLFAERLRDGYTWLLQEFQRNILTKGEYSYMLFGGVVSHAIVKRGKAGEYRIQDDHGGSWSPRDMLDDEVAFARKASAAANDPAICRVDMLHDNEERLVLGELEVIEPELWFRMRPTEAADLFAAAVKKHIDSL